MEDDDEELAYTALYILSLSLTSLLVLNAIALPHLAFHPYLFFQPGKISSHLLALVVIYIDIGVVVVVGGLQIFNFVSAVLGRLYNAYRIWRQTKH